MPRLGITTASHGTLVLSHIWKNSLESLPLLGQSAKSLSNLNGHVGTAAVSGLRPD